MPGGMNVGGKRSIRQQQMNCRTRFVRNRSYTSSSHSPVDTATPPQNIGKEVCSSNTTVSAICHPSVPDLHCLGNIGFEALFVLYLLTALFCQYIYLYKTVWWYPVTLPPSTTSLNFHLIDHNLTLFLAVFLSRRFVWSLLWDFLRPNPDNAPRIIAWLLICFFTGILWLFFLMMPLAYLFYSTSLLNMVVLCYPILLWVPLTGLSGDSCLNLIITWLSMTDVSGKIGTDSVGSGSSLASHSTQNKRCDLDVTSQLLNQPESSGSQIDFAALGNSSNPHAIRNEVKLLCQDFNSRISEIVFCSMVCAYYVGLVPMFFMKSHQYYDMTWSLQHTILVLLNSFALLSSHLLNPRYLHVLHKCALLLGDYKLENDSAKAGNSNIGVESETDGKENALTSLERKSGIKEWSADSVFQCYTKVKHNGKIYQSTGIHNVAEPEDVTHYRFYFMFNDPLRIMNWLLLAHVIVVLFQIYLLISSLKWDHLISIALMQFFSYYVLFRSLRDRIVLGKAHSFHHEVYKSNST
uniref:transmembrane protein 39A-like n=1 Tax=Styela clava TaxID=7725 RepID=UPI0019392843|nr:transmembrane protein 39A-like [Styela clava]